MATLRISAMAALVAVAVLTPPDARAASDTVAPDAIARTPDPLARFSAAERADLKRIETYLNNISTIKSRFVQANPDGSYSEGTLYMQRPGRLRFEYDPPDPYLIIARGKWFIYVDKELEEATYLPLKQTPAYFIVQPEIRFGNALKIMSFRRGDGVLRVELAQTDQPDAGRVMLVFTDRPLQLRKWRVVDVQGNLTDTTLINPRFGVPLADSLFVYNDTQGGGN